MNTAVKFVSYINSDRDHLWYGPSSLGEGVTEHSFSGHRHFCPWYQNNPHLFHEYVRLKFRWSQNDDLFIFRKQKQLSTCYVHFASHQKYQMHTQISVVGCFFGVTVLLCSESCTVIEHVYFPLNEPHILDGTHLYWKRSRWCTRVNETYKEGCVKTTVLLKVQERNKHETAGHQCSSTPWHHVVSV